MTTQMHRIVCVLMAVVMAALVLAGWFLVAQPQLAAASASIEQSTAAQSQISASQANLRRLQEQKSKLASLTMQLAALQQSIPANLASSPLVAGLDREAASAGVFITDISVDDPADYAPAPASTASPARAASSGASPTPSPSATPTAAPGPDKSGKKAYAPVTNSRVTANNFIPVPVSITVEGRWGSTLAFVKNLRTGTRLYAVGTLSSKIKADDPHKYTTIVTGYVFAILDPATLAAETAKKTAASDAKKAAKGATPTPGPSATETPGATVEATPAPKSSGAPAPTGTATP